MRYRLKSPWVRVLPQDDGTFLIQLPELEPGISKLLSGEEFNRIIEPVPGPEDIPPRYGPRQSSR